MSWFQSKSSKAKASFADLSEYGGDSFVSGLASFSTNNKRTLVAEYQELVYSCVRVIAEEMGKYDPYFYTMDGPQEKVDSRHPMKLLLDNPNPHMSKFELFEASQSYMELAGECFWLMTLGDRTGVPVRIDIVRPDFVEVAIQDVPDPNGIYMVGDVIGYTVMNGRGERIPLSTKEMVHFKEFNPFNSYRGYSTIEAGLVSIGIDRSTSMFQKRFMDNNATPQSIVSFKGNIGKEAFEKVKKVFSERHAGVKNAGKTLFIRDTDVDVKQLGLSLADLDLKDLKTITSERVRGMFRVPMPLLGTTSGVGLGRAGVESEEYVFQKYPIEAKKTRFDDQLRMACLQYWPKNTEVRVGHKSNIPEDSQLLLKEHSELTGKVMTINEVRKTRNLPEVEGGDQLYVSFNVVRIDKQDTGDNPNDDKEDRDPKDEPVEGEDDNNGDIPEQFKMVVRKKIPVVEKSAEVQLYDTLGLIEDSGLEEYRTKIVSLLEKQEQQMLDKYDLFSGKSIETQIVPDVEREAELFTAALLLIMLKYMQRGGETGLAFVGSNLDFLIDRATQEAIANSTERLLRSFNEETVKAIQASLREGLSNRESQTQIADRIRSVYSDAKGYRADRIARTEIHNVVNEGLANGYGLAGVKYVRWFAEPGACEFCATMAGSTVEIGTPFVTAGGTIVGTAGGTFTANYGDVKYANMHSNCRCTLVPVRELAAGMKELVRVEVPVEIETVETEELRKALLEQSDYVAELEKIVGVDGGPDPES